jgi:nucleotide-binding universal stress UspA family protein
MDRILSIVVPTDFGVLSQAAARRAGTLSRLDGASIHSILIPELAESLGSQLIVMGTRGNSGISRLMRRGAHDSDGVVLGPGSQRTDDGSVE